MKNTNRGITLIALVITIIILLILAGVTIQQLSESNIFEKAKQAKEKTKIAQEREKEILNSYEEQARVHGTVREGILGITSKLSKTDITSTTWTKMELTESIDNYKFLQFYNGSDSDGHLSILNSFIVSVNYFKNNYNDINKYIEVVWYLENNCRSVYFYYNKTENAVYAKTAHSSYIPGLIGIK